MTTNNCLNSHPSNFGLKYETLINPQKHRRGLVARVLFRQFQYLLYAHTPHAGEAHGVVQANDYQRRISTLTDVQEHDPQKLRWKPTTQFLRDQKLVPAMELKPGT